MNPPKAKAKWTAMSSEARGILILLGFDGVWDYAKRTGINHETAGSLIGTIAPRFRKKHNIIVLAHEALHTAYMEHRSQMSRPMRNYIKDWVKRWQKYLVNDMLWLTSPGRVLHTKYSGQAKQMKKRQAGIKAGVIQAIGALKWE